MRAPPPAEDVSRLRLRVTEIVNPGAGQLGVRVTVVDPASGARQELGRFAVFPAEQTGDYVLPVRGTAAAMLETSEAVVEFALTRDTTGDPDLSVALTPHWE